jgi:uncharacterized membrane-anchored protein YhcB (DUF1043 family)
MSIDPTTLGFDVWVALALIFATGLGLGVWLRRPDAKTRGRIATLEAELVDARAQLESQRAGVAKHFERTGELFRDLTGQYTALYAHLAEGARKLCPDPNELLGRGFAELPPALQADLTNSDAEIALNQTPSNSTQMPAATEAVASGPETATERQGVH